MSKRNDNWDKLSVSEKIDLVSLLMDDPGRYRYTTEFYEVLVETFNLSEILLIICFIGVRDNIDFKKVAEAVASLMELPKCSG